MDLRSRSLPVVIAAALLAAMFTIECATARQESQTIDEAVHLAAGFSYWKTGDYRLNPEHPPLIKLLAAVPLLFTNAELPTADPSWHDWDQYAFGEAFLYHNTLPPQTLLFLGRIPIMLLSIGLGVLIFSVSRGLFGPWGGVLSVALYALDPNFIAHGHYVTTDLGFAFFAAWTVERLSRLYRRPSRRNAILFGLVFLAAGLSKFSGLPFLVALVVTVVLLKFHDPHHPLARFRPWVRGMAIGLPLAIVLVWSLYGFDVRRRADDPRIGQLYAQRTDFLSRHDPATLSPLVRFVLFTVGDANLRTGSWLERTSHWPIPGYAFFRGVITVVGHSVGGQESYLLGRYRDAGWWYYFPVAILVKTPLPTLIAMFGLIVVTVAYVRHRRRMRTTFGASYRAIPREWLVYLTVPIVFFLISLTSNLNLGWRHIMPVYPFLFILAGFFASRTFLAGSRTRTVVPLGLGLAILIVQPLTYPNELGYFNAAAGGSQNGHRLLLDSNLDWGQDIYKLVGFMREHRLDSIPYAGYGRVPTGAYFASTPLPTVTDVATNGRPHGYVAISVGQLYGRQRLYDWLLTERPAAVLGAGVYVYQFP